MHLRLEPLWFGRRHRRSHGRGGAHAGVAAHVLRVLDYEVAGRRGRRGGGRRRALHPTASLAWEYVNDELLCIRWISIWSFLTNPCTTYWG